jgi:hypothetical protein
MMGTGKYDTGLHIDVNNLSRSQLNIVEYILLKIKTFTQLHPQHGGMGTAHFPAKTISGHSYYRPMGFGLDLSGVAPLSTFSFQISCQKFLQKKNLKNQPRL